ISEPIGAIPRSRTSSSVGASRGASASSRPCSWRSWSPCSGRSPRIGRPSASTAARTAPMTPSCEPTTRCSPRWPSATRSSTTAGAELCLLPVPLVGGALPRRRTTGVRECAAKILGSCPGTSQKTDRKSTRLNSSHVSISYAVFCLKKKNIERHVDVHHPLGIPGEVNRPALYLDAHGVLHLDRLRRSAAVASGDQLATCGRVRRHTH